MKNHGPPPSNELVPDYIRNLVVYQAGRPIQEVMKERNLTKVVKLASNENPLGPSPFAIREMTKALWDVHYYPDMHCHDVKTALAKLYKLKKENIILGNGSEGILSYIVRTFVRPKDEVLTSAMSFIGPTILARSVGANLKTVPLTNDYRYDVKAMANAISAQTKVIYIANPNNPTGTYIKKEEFDYLMSHVPERTLVILDEAYFEFAQIHDDYPDSMDYRYDNVITLRTFSKAYGMAGIRIGYGFAHEELIAHLHKVRLPFEPNAIAQTGAIGALQDRPHLERTIKNNSSLYPQLFNFLADKNLNPIKSVANFVTFKTGSDKASRHLFEALLDEGVIIRPLSSNEMPEYMRVSIGTPEEMDFFYQAFDKVFPKFKQEFSS